MNDNAKALVAALRSGDYKQTTDRLRVEDKFCCLGVACDLYSKEVGGEWVENYPGPYFFRIDSHTSSVTSLPEPVRDWLGFTTHDGELDDDTTLTAKNDGGYTFDKIADIIETEPKKLFVSST